MTATDMSDQILNVNEIANDTTIERSALERKVKDKIGRNVTLDTNIAIIEALQSVTSLVVPALLLKVHGGAGAVYIHDESAELVDRVKTGPDERQNFQIILLKEGQNCRFYGRPTVWYFRISE
ncbi:hypothetical protein McanMca71_005376 [Microsporum canis]|uniref:Uncharacterized protein n=1 Tax=Arthroderma otae (strain ATCC MYA-4605 / CBS 113480) TaxID=554155 RepID=C5G1D5_ARTOC|nr:uncharacterized protein MCYG_08757 [Microsporum canis CBS 113480]EEQ28598.1 predicted protein [Microsporum canis CBS 113480]